MGAAAVPIMIGATVLGGITQAYGQIKAGDAEKRQASYEAEVLRNNAAIAYMAADDTLEKNKVVVQERGVQTAQTIGEQRAAGAAQGVDVNQGSITELAVDAARIGALDEKTATENAKRQALAYIMQGKSFEKEAEAALIRGRDAKSSSRISAIGTLLGTAGSVATKWGK